jgi:acetyltransferase-like isoleucine patch superfamily enzyme
VNIVDRLRRASFPELARKIPTNVLALAAGAVHLRACDEVGARARCFGGRPHVENAGSIAIGDDFATSCEFGTLRMATGPNGSLVIGDSVTINYGTSITARMLVRLGSRVKIGPYCVVCDTELPLPLADDPASPIEIGNDVWLGARVVVLPGTVIGDGAVISAGSVVSGIIPPRAIVSGNPARVLRVQGTDAAAA